MAVDIEKLRDSIALIEDRGYVTLKTEEVLDVLTEIDQLRAENARLSKSVELWQEQAMMTNEEAAELDRLRAANRGLSRQLREADVEIARLGAALEKKPASELAGPDVKAELRARLNELSAEYGELDEECEAWKVRALNAEALLSLREKESPADP